ncbi:MAG TPA: RibD family protein [Polyangiaceae bacterium]|nr:RibD family protein [Polyangiaceae bacterium]
MRPTVTLHFAQSLDGRIGLGKQRERALLSSELGVLRAHQARGRHDAVLIGVETLLHDDPLLTARGPSGGKPLRVVLDSALRTPPSARLLADAAAAGAGRALVIGCAERASAARRRALEAAGAEVLLTSSTQEGRVALTEALGLLAARGAQSLLVEGGAQVLTAFLQAGLASRAEVEIAPVWFGAPATPSLCELGVTRTAQALKLEHIEVENLGQSLLVCGNVLYPSRGSA